MKCFVCGGDTFYEWGRVERYAIIRCSACGLGITDPFPNSEEMSRINTENYDIKQRIDTYLSRQDYFENRYRFQLLDIKEVMPIGRLLDIGCNIGLFLKVAETEGYSVTGIEVNKDCAAFARKEFNLNVHSEFLEDVRFPEGSFEVVTLFDVLEHVPEPRLLLAEIRRILAPNGVLMVQMPNLDSFMARITGSNWQWLTPPDHLYHFTPGTLRRILQESGFSINKFVTWDSLEDISYNLYSAYLPNNILGRGIRKVLRQTGIVIQLLKIMQASWQRNFRGGLLLAVCTKNKDHVI